MRSSCITRWCASLPNSHENSRIGLTNFAVLPYRSCSNISEGAAKQSDADFNRYLKNSLGSCAEITGGLDVAYNEKLMTHVVLQELLIRCRDVSNQLGGFSKKLVGKRR